MSALLFSKISAYIPGLMNLSVKQIESPMIKTCSIWRSLEILGDTPILLILESMWLGSTRFTELKDRTGLQKALLSNRLHRLIKNGLLRKGQAVGGSRHLEYRLTEKGVDLFPTVLTLYVWERKWGSADSRRNLELQHEACGSRLNPVPVCRSCGKAFGLHEVSFVEGPGVGLMPASYSRRRNQVTFQSDHPSLLRGSVEILGDRWSALIMRAIFTALRRFDEIEADTGASPAIVADRLKNLVAIDVLKARPYNHHPLRNEYFLTTKGLEYYSVIMMLMLWGDKYYGAADGPPAILTHTSCGAHLIPEISCGSCDKTVAPQDVAIVGLND